MKKALLVMGFVFVVGMGTAEASQFSDGIRKTWGYLFAPVNCVGQLASDVVAAGTKFVVCVLANANPANLIP